MLVLTKLKLYKHSLHILNINPLSSPRISPSLTRSNQLASPLALQKTTAVSSKRALTDFISRKISFIMMDICFYHCIHGEFLSTTPHISIARQSFHYLWMGRHQGLRTPHFCQPAWAVWTQRGHRQHSQVN